MLVAQRLDPALAERSERLVDVGHPPAEHRAGRRVDPIGLRQPQLDRAQAEDEREGLVGDELQPERVAVEGKRPGGVRDGDERDRLTLFEQGAPIVSSPAAAGRGTLGSVHGPGGHDHASGSGLGVDLSRAGSKRALRLVLVLTTAFLAAEVVGGIVADSLALLADAGHMLSDTLSLGVALFAAWLAGRPGGPSRTFGFRRAEILAALFNGVTLVAISIWIFVEAGMRFSDPPDVEAGLMLAIAVGGLVINVVSARILYGHSGESLNVSAAFRHVIADLLGSIGVIVAAVIILATGWDYADPAISVGIGVLILASSWGILRDSLQILLEGSPPGMDVGAGRHGDGRRAGRQGGPRPARVDDHVRLPGARRARARRSRYRLPRDAARPRADAGDTLRARAHDPAGRPRGRRAAADRAAPAGTEGGGGG